MKENPTSIILNYLVCALMACFFAFRAWGFYPCMFVFATLGLVVGVVNMMKYRG